MSRQEDIEEVMQIETSRPKYGFPKNILVGGERTILRAYKLLPENFRDILEEFVKNGFSGDFRRLVVADLFTHTFFFKRDRDEDELLQNQNDPSDFRGRIAHHPGHHHMGPPPEHHHHHHDDLER